MNRPTLIFRLSTVTHIGMLAAMLVAIVASCSRHDVGDEKNNPAPSSHLTLEEGQSMGQKWAEENRALRRWATPTPTSSMVPYMDSHSVLLLHAVVSPVRLHDILIMNEGPGRENICHQVVRLDGTHVYLSGKNNQWPDGWIPLTAAKWRVVATIYTRG